MDDRSLERIEFHEITAAIAMRASSVRGAASLRLRRPLADPGERAEACGCLDEALRRQQEPGPWCATGPGDLRDTLDTLERGPIEGVLLVDVRDWLDAGAATREAWAADAMRDRYPRLGARVARLPELKALRDRLGRSLEGDGKLRDDASPELRRLRADAMRAERRLGEQIERWARGFGSDAYVTRHGDRFVAMVPAAGFPRRRGIVHDLSASGQSLLVEPIELCGENNQMIEARHAALEEERRILAELGALTLAARDALASLEDGLVELDAARAAARWALEFGGRAIHPEGEALHLREARHPLLAMGVGGRSEAVVPLDLDLHHGRARGRLLLLSGPNMGGKTVLLKTVGLAVALAHAGLPVLAAEGSRVPEVDELIADLGDDQSLAEGLSTFAAHLRTLGEMIGAAGSRTFVLCDELGAGTDPEDGAALARALLERLAGAATWGVVTTHLGTLKRVVGEVEGIENGSLEFDIENLASRFRFLPGVPGSSHALAVATRLGFPADLIERARALRPAGADAGERLLAELADTVQSAREERDGLVVARRRSEAEAERFHQATEDVRQEEAQLRRRLTRESEGLLSRTRALWQTVEREARREDKTRARAETLRLEIAAADQEVETLGRDPHGAGTHTPLEAILPGMLVRVADLGIEAEVVSAPDREGRVQLKRGAWNIQSHVDRLAPAAAAPAPARTPGGTWALPENVPLEVDLRGMDAEEAIQTLDQGVDRAVLAGLTELRIIHGIGRGVLRAVVERHLEHHAQVAGQRPGGVGEGGRGVTIAGLR